MKVQAINNNCNNPSFGVVKYNKAGLERLNKFLGANAQDFIQSQSYNNTADILLIGDKVKVLYKNNFYEMQNYRKTKFEELLLEDDSHFHVNDGGECGFDIFPTDYPMYLEHLSAKWTTVPYKLGDKRGLFVTNTNIAYSLDYGLGNDEYANAHEMASHLDKFELAHIDVEKRMLFEDNSWTEIYEKNDEKLKSK